MSSQLLSGPGLWVKRAVPVAVAVTALILSSANAHAQSCKAVNGHYVEHAVQENCLSPVGLCIAGEYSGGIKGSFEGAATSLVPTADTPTTSALLFTSDSVIHAQVNGKTGDLMIKNAGVFRSIGDGEIVDLQVITGGTGDLEGATGVLRASGLFNPATGMGESNYIGSICLP